MKNKGFTLIELLVTISISALLLCTSVAGFSSLRSSLSLKGAAGQTAETLHLAKYKAVSGSVITEVSCRSDACILSVLDLLAGTYKEIKKTILPEGIDFKEDIAFRFASSGYPLPGYIGTAVIRNSNGSLKKVIVSSVGRIRIE